MEKQCSQCQHQNIQKQTKIVSEPKTLIIQIKRYEFNQYTQKTVKKNEPILCPQEIVLPRGSKYCLSSIINHIGSSPDVGHYTVTLFDKTRNAFLLLDDSTIRDNVKIVEDMWKQSYIFHRRGSKAQIHSVHSPINNPY